MRVRQPTGPGSKRNPPSVTRPFDRVMLGDVVTPTGTLVDGWVAIRGETVAGTGRGEAPPAAVVSDHRGRLIFPGLVDGHMHTGSSMGFPGIEGATRAAAAGGVTTCVDMPYDVPQSIHTAALLDEKIGWMNRTAHVDVALYGTIRKTGGIEHIAELAAGGISAFKLSTYEYDAVRFPRIDHPTMVAAFREIARTGLPVAVHNEDQELVERLTADALAAGHTSAIWHARTRPPLAETMADLEIFEIGLATGAHVHIAHSSLARGFDLASTFSAMGMTATGEACIQYLCMTEDDLVRLGGRGKCNPPFRTQAEVEQVWQALLDGKVSNVSTDHAPWPVDRKGSANIFECGAGLTGLQTFAALMFTLLEERGLPHGLMAEYCARRPAALHGLAPRKGAIEPGADADLVVMARETYAFDEATIVDRPEMRWSPYHGRMMRGRVVETVLRGTTIWDGQSVVGHSGAGRFVRRGGRA